MVLAQKQKYRPMEQNRKPRNKPMHIWTPYIWQRRQEYATAAAKLLQSCPNLCDTIDGSPPGSSVPGILQARPLESVAISFSNAGKWKVKVKSLNHVQLFAAPWTVAYQALPCMKFSMQEYWSGLPFPSPEDLPDSGIEPRSPAL